MMVQDNIEIKEIIELFRNIETKQARNKIMELYSYDTARAFVSLNDDERQKVYEQLSPSDIAPIMAELDDEQVVEYFNEMMPEYVGAIISEMETDDASDILNELDDNQVVENYLKYTDDFQASNLKKLMTYKDDTAGSLMNADYLALKQTLTIKEAMKKVIKDAPDVENISMLYVVDDTNKLLGVLSLKSLIIGRETDNLLDLSIINYKYATPNIDQEEVANMMRQYDLSTLPVIDDDTTMLGFITFDDVYDVIVDEVVEDFEKFAAMNDLEEAAQQSVFKNVFTRSPWLFFLVILGLFIAQILEAFEATLIQIAMLSFFVPLIAGVTGNTATQTLALTLRRFSNEEDDFTKKDKITHVLKEISVGSLLGCLIGFAIFLVINAAGLVGILSGETFTVSLIVGVTVLISLTLATFTGSTIPLLLKRLGLDPAITSGPFITTINDLVSITVYVILATIVLHTFM